MNTLHSNIWTNCAESGLLPWKNESRQSIFPPCHISVASRSSAAESPQRKRCQSSNYKQQIYSGQSPQRGWSFVKAEQRKMLHNRGVVSVLFILDELLNPMCWNDYSLKNKQKSTFSCKSQKVTWKVGKSSEGRGFSSVSVSVSYSS